MTANQLLIKVPTLTIIVLTIISCNREPFRWNEDFENNNLQKNSDLSTPSPLKTAIVGAWQCTGKEPIYNREGTHKIEFYKNEDIIMYISGVNVSGTYKFKSENNIKMEWSSDSVRENSFHRYDVSLSANKLTLSSISSRLSCDRIR